MAQKDRSVRRIDEHNPNIVTGGGQLIQQGQSVVATPAFPSAPPPENVVVASGQALLRTTYTPKVLVAVSWEPPINLLPEIYSIEAAEDVNFQVSLQRWTTTLTSGVIELKPNEDYWIRVQAIVRGVYSEYGYPSNYPVAAIHTIADTTPPEPVTGVATNWTTGDLRFTWTNPSSDNFFQTRIRIYDTFGGTLYVEDYIVGNPGSVSSYVFTVAMNNRATGNNPLTTVYYELLAYSIGGVPSATTVTGTVTKAKPTQPVGLTSSWSGDDGTYDEGVTFTWTAVTGATLYSIVIDGVAKTTPIAQYHYSYSENVANHRPTLVSGDHTLSVTVQAVDPLGQASPGASGTATNLAPVASNLSLTTVPGFSALFAYVAPTKEILDFHHYTWILASGSTEIQRVTTFTPETSFTSLNGTYAIAIQAVDMFGRSSAKVSVSGIALDGLTITQLRAETQYTNSLGTNPTTLNGLKDNNLVQSVFTVASGTAWQWTKAERPLLDRYHAVTLALSGAATNMPRVYFGFSADDVTYAWYAGPLVATGTTGQSTTLTAYANETLAQNNATLATNINRYDLPAITEARFVKMGHRGNTHFPAEYYPRRLIQSDDGEFEFIKSINIAADAVLANHIFVVNLAAINADMGNLHMDGVIDIESTGGIYQGTGSFASPTTGLKIYNTGGIGRLTLYSGGIAQVDTTTNGILTAGAGAVRLTASGISIYTLQTATETVTGYPQYQLRWLNRANTSQQVAAILGEIDVGDTRILRMFSYAPTSSQDSTIRLYADSTTRAGINTPGLTIVNSADLGFRTVDIDGQDQINLNSAVTTASNQFDSDADGIRTLGTNAGFTFEDRVSSRLWQWYGSSDFANLHNGSRVVWQTTDAGAAFYLYEDASTNTVVTPVNIYRRSTGTPAAGLGSQIFFALEGSTGVDRSAGGIQVLWTDATDTSRNSDMRFFAYDGNGATNNAREGFRIGSTAANVAGIGFFGNSAAARQTVTGTLTGATLAQLTAVVNSLIDGLAAYSLITDSTT
jgi:hypothetical protein